MTPAFVSPAIPFRPAAQMATPPVQAAGFGALLSVSSTLVAEQPEMPVAFGELISSPPVVQENRAATVATPEADIEANILPLLAAFGGGAAPQTSSIVSHASISDEVSISEVESDEAQPAQRECAETVVSVPVAIPITIASPAIVAATLAPAMLPSVPATAKANPPPKAAVPKDRPSAMAPDVEIGVPTQAVPVPTVTARQNITPALRQQTQEAPLLVIHPGANPVADLEGLLASAPVESNSVLGAGFQAVVSDRIADTGIRPLSDASALVAERALDVARGGLWLDQLAGDIAAVQDHDRELAFRLIPAQLGQLDVKIATRDDGIQLNFSTQTDEAASIIATAQPRLMEELKAQGVRVAGCEVNAGSGQSSFSQQNGEPVYPEIIAEFDRPSPDFPEPTNPSQPQNGRFA
jgi:flagellar hook-length control protein FliK